MNWRLSALDNITLISNSDAHSCLKIGREANVFEGGELNYKSIIEAIKMAEDQQMQIVDWFLPLNFSRGR